MLTSSESKQAALGHQFNHVILPTAASLVFLLGIVIAFAGCGKRENITYRSEDRRIALTLISKDECELQIENQTLLGKYTKQSDALRVIVPNFGMNEVIYYRLTKDGLQRDNGDKLLSPTAFAEEEKRSEKFSESIRKEKAEKAEREARRRSAQHE